MSCPECEGSGLVLGYSSDRTYPCPECDGTVYGVSGDEIAFKDLVDVDVDGLVAKFFENGDQS